RGTESDAAGLPGRRHHLDDLGAVRAQVAVLPDQARELDARQRRRGRLGRRGYRASRRGGGGGVGSGPAPAFVLPGGRGGGGGCPGPPPAPAVSYARVTG